MGASTAFHLATGGFPDVVLLERETLASGSTSRSAGGARLQFADELNVRLSLRSLDEFERWDALIGEHVEFVPEIAFRQVGYLFLLDTPGQRRRRSARRSRCSTRTASPRASSRPPRRAEIVPQLELDGILARDVLPARRAHEPRGRRPGLCGRGGRARRTGAAGLPGDRASSTRRPHHRRAHGRAGTIATDTVVCAAGAWSREVGAMAGVDDPGARRAAAHVVLARARRPARRPAAHDRLHDELLLPPRGARHRLRRARGGARGRRRARAASACR